MARFRVGREYEPPNLLVRIEHCSFGSPDVASLEPVLPHVILTRGGARRATLTRLVADETAHRPARELMLELLLEVLLIEALRCVVRSEMERRAWLAALPMIALGLLRLFQPGRRYATDEIPFGVAYSFGRSPPTQPRA